MHFGGLYGLYLKEFIDKKMKKIIFGIVGCRRKGKNVNKYLSLGENSYQFGDINKGFLQRNLQNSIL